MQKHHLLWLLLPALTACNSPKLTPEEIIWQRCDSVLNAIQLTSIPSTEFNIKDYGALAVVEGRDTAIATTAIDAAILGTLGPIFTMIFAFLFLKEFWTL